MRRSISDCPVSDAGCRAASSAFCREEAIDPRVVISRTSVHAVGILCCRWSVALRAQSFPGFLLLFDALLVKKQIRASILMSVVLRFSLLCIRLDTNVLGLSMFGFKCQFLLWSPVLAARGSTLLSLVQINLTLLKKLQDANGLGLKVVSGKDYCRVVIQYPSNTVSKWVSACLLCQAKFLPDADLPSPISASRNNLHNAFGTYLASYAFETEPRVQPSTCSTLLATATFHDQAFLSDVYDVYQN